MRKLLEILQYFFTGDCETAYRRQTLVIKRFWKTVKEREAKNV